MLQGGLYTISSIQKQETSTGVTLELNARHSIFEGHFPGQPVMPGACLVQMVKEIMQVIISKKIQLQKAKHLKFISMIDPSMDNHLQMQLTHSGLEENEVTVTATLSNNDVVCFKFDGVFGVIL